MNAASISTLPALKLIALWQFTSPIHGLTSHNSSFEFALRAAIAAS
jgi:hypothetical protein